MSDTETPDLTKLTVDLLSAYFASNSVASEDLANLIQSTRAALAGPAGSAEDLKVQEPIYTPAVSVRKSIANPDHLISLIDGKPYKTLKRHLSSHGLTIADYKARYKLPAEYPTVAPTYSQARRETAARIGLGSRPTAAAPTTVDAVTTEAVPRLENAAVTPDAPAPTPEKAVPAKSRSNAKGEAVKTKAAAKPATQAKPATRTKSAAKPRAVKSKPGAGTKAPVGAEGAIEAAPPTAKAKPARKATVKTAPRTADAPAASAVEATKAAPRPRSKLKIATPTA